MVLCCVCKRLTWSGQGVAMSYIVYSISTSIRIGVHESMRVPWGSIAKMTCLHTCTILLTKAVVTRCRARHNSRLGYTCIISTSGSSEE